MSKAKAPYLIIAAVSLIDLYRNILRPHMLPSCRFVPSCSEYAKECLERYGLLGGFSRISWRLIRCNPFSNKLIDYPR